MPETTVARAGAGALAEDVNPPAGGGARRWWRRAGVAFLGVLLLVAGVAIYGAYGYVPPEPGRSYHSAYLDRVPGHYVDTSVARFFYLHQGTGTPVVLISPGGAPAYAWHNQLTALAAAGHSVYVVDMPGQGRTVLHDSRFGWDLPAMTGALASFLDQAMYHHALVTPQLVNEFWAPATYRVNRLATVLLERRLDWAQTQARLRSTATRTLILWGRQDRVLAAGQASRMAWALPHASVHVLPGCGHLLELDCPGQADHYLGRFLAPR